MTSDAREDNEILGRGIAFPLQFHDGQLGMNAYESQVAQSIRLILGTAKGERVMRPDFGAGMERLAFEPNNTVTAILIQRQVQEALLRHEPRIEVLSVTVNTNGSGTNESPADGKLYININYRVKVTDSVSNLVYPFYIERGEFV